MRQINWCLVDINAVQQYVASKRHLPYSALVSSRGVTTDIWFNAQTAVWFGVNSVIRPFRNVT